jgi:MFS family permease
MLVTAVLVISLGRIGDIFGRVRIYNLGFLVFSIASILLASIRITKQRCHVASDLALVQGVGGAMFSPTHQRSSLMPFPGRTTRACNWN